MDETLNPDKPGRWPSLAAAALILCLPILAAGCSGSGSGGHAGATDDEDYPNLSRVPGEQPRPTPDSLRDELIDGLAADHANARYSGEALTPALAAVAPATPPPAAKAKVEINWEGERVGTEEEASDTDEPAAEETAAEDEPAREESVAPAEDGDSQEELEINWEGERVDPSGKVIAAGGDDVKEELILAPGPELVGVVYFDDESDEVGGGDRDLLEQLVALYKERGGRLRLVGHSSAGAGFEDEVAQRIADLDLSLKRANAVASTLVDLGAEKDKLKIEAKADGDPANGEVIVGGEASHRRVEIFLEH